MYPSLLVASTVRNVAKTLHQDISVLRRALEHRFIIKWLFIESDSQDNTVALLKSLSIADPAFRYISLGTLTPLYQERESRLAYCRNTYLEQLESFSDYKDTTYIFIADCDGLNNSLSSNAVDSCFDNGIDWDGCFPNQRGPYHDIYALRHESWNPTCPLEQLRFCQTHSVPYHEARNLALFSKMLTIDENSEWINVLSAFGGCAMYRASSLRGLRYHGHDSNGNTLCEHVSLNLALSQRGNKLLINPRFINTSISHHSRPAVYPARLFLKTKFLVSRLLHMTSRLCASLFF